MTGEERDDNRDVLYRKKVYLDNAFSIPLEIARAVAHVSNTDILELEPLYTYVDSDALDDLMETDTDINVTFDYGGIRSISKAQTSLRLRF